MSQIRDRAVLILRVLEELNAYPPNAATVQQVIEKTGWTPDEYWQVDEYLKEKKWIKGTTPALMGVISYRNGFKQLTPEPTLEDYKRSITAEGTDALSSAMAHRMSLSLVAERIARWLNERDPKGKGISHSTVIKELDIEKSGYEQAMRDLLDLNLVEDRLQRGNIDIIVSFPRLTKAGSLAVKRGFVRDQTPPSVTDSEAETPAQVINILNVFDSQIQNLAQTGGASVISQSVDPGLSKALFKIIDEMVEVVRSRDDIEPSIKKDYELEAEGLKVELKKSRLNLSRIRDMFSFLADVEGNLGLARNLAPYVLMLTPHITELLSQLPR